MSGPVDIVYHNPSVMQPDRWPGERARQLVKALERNGACIRAIPPVAPLTEDKPVRSVALPRAWIRNRVPVAWRSSAIKLRQLQRGTLNSVRWSWKLWRDLHRAPPDVLLARYLEFDWTPLIISRLLRCPLVLEVHSPFALEGVLRGGRPSRLAAWMDRGFWRRAEMIWVHTPALRDLIGAQGTNPGKLRLVPFGVEDPGFVAAPAPAQEAVELVFVGSFYPWHGTEELLAAFGQLHNHMPRVKLTLIGDGLTAGRCVEKARLLGLEQAVTFTGWLDRRAVYGHLQASHIGVAPYRDTEYGYFEPVKILDYQMAGLPIVASDVGHIPQMVKDGENGLLVPPGDIDALATALMKLASDPGLRSHMGLASRRRASSVDETANAVLEMCQEVGAASS